MKRSAAYVAPKLVATRRLEGALQSMRTVTDGDPN